MDKSHTPLSQVKLATFQIYGNLVGIPGAIIETRAKRFLRPRKDFVDALGLPLELAMKCVSGC